MRVIIIRFSLSVLFAVCSGFSSEKEATLSTVLGLGLTNAQADNLHSGFPSVGYSGGVQSDFKVGERLVLQHSFLYLLHSHSFGKEDAKGEIHYNFFSTEIGVGAYLYRDRLYFVGGLGFLSLIDSRVKHNRIRNHIDDDIKLSYQPFFSGTYNISKIFAVELYVMTSNTEPSQSNYENYSLNSGFLRFKYRAFHFGAQK